MPVSVWCVQHLHAIKSLAITALEARRSACRLEICAHAAAGSSTLSLLGWHVASRAASRCGALAGTGVVTMIMVTGHHGCPEGRGTGREEPDVAGHVSPMLICGAMSDGGPPGACASDARADESVRTGLQRSITPGLMAAPAVRGSPRDPHGVSRLCTVALPSPGSPVGIEPKRSPHSGGGFRRGSGDPSAPGRPR